MQVHSVGSIEWHCHEWPALKALLTDAHTQYIIPCAYHWGIFNFLHFCVLLYFFPTLPGGIVCSPMHVHSVGSIEWHCHEWPVLKALLSDAHTPYIISCAYYWGIFNFLHFCVLLYFFPTLPGGIVCSPMHVHSVGSIEWHCHVCIVPIWCL